jgi:hypothetical protein
MKEMALKYPDISRRYSSVGTSETSNVTKIVLVGAVALLAACASSQSSVSVSTAGGRASIPATAGSTAAAGETISVQNFGDLPRQCVDLLSTYLKAIEPTVSSVDWTKATLADVETVGAQFKAESDTYDTQSSAAGCDEYDITGSDAAQVKQIIGFAAANARGTIGYLTFMGSLSGAGDATGSSVPTDCAGTIAEIDSSYLTAGKTMKDLTMAEVTRFEELMKDVTTSCTEEESQAFAARDDLQAFIST